jgi:glycosyltransferase involved in cell wall biosynthesis
MALLEAMAAGVPCVATAVGGIPELFADDRGLSVPAGDPISLAAAMTRLARSPDLRARIAANALDTIRTRFALDRVVDEYLRLLGLPPQAP